MKPTPSKLKYLPAALFCLFLFIMFLLLFLLPKATYSPDEKRVLQETPQFSWQSLADGTFGKNVESYLSDHVAGRKFFVGVNAYYNLFTGRNGANNIYKAKDGYLINTPVTPNEENLQKNLLRFREFVSKTGLPAQLLAVPSTGYILEEKLPAAHLTYHDRALFDEIQTALDGAITFVDPTDLFLQQKEARQLYYKTDHHWTTAGAYTAYTQLCSALSLKPTPEESFQKEIHGGFYGTTFSRSGLWLESSDNIELWKPPGTRQISIEEENQKTVMQEDLFFRSHLNESDQYPVFLDGNHGLVRIKNPDGGSKKLLLIKDSFAHSLAPFLSAHYGEIIMVDLRYYHASLSELSENEGVDQILFVYGLDNLVNDKNSVWLK